MIRRQGSRQGNVHRRSREIPSQAALRISVLQSPAIFVSACLLAEGMKSRGPSYNLALRGITDRVEDLVRHGVGFLVRRCVVELTQFPRSESGTSDTLDDRARRRVVPSSLQAMSNTSEVCARLLGCEQVVATCRKGTSLSAPITALRYLSLSAALGKKCLSV